MRNLLPFERFRAGAALVVALVLGIGWLQYWQWNRFEAAVSENRASIEWDVFQLQAERYKMLAKLNEALLTHGEPEVMDSLALRYEVLISRLEIMRSGTGPREAFRLPENRPFFERMEAFAAEGDAYFGVGGEPGGHGPAFDELRVRSLRAGLEGMGGSMQDLILNINTIHKDMALERHAQLRQQAVVSGMTALALSILVGAMGLLAFRQLVKARQNNAALTASERRLTGLIDTAKDAIISIDASQRVIVFNSAAESMFGRTAADMIGQPLDLLLPELPRSIGPLSGLTAMRASGEVFPIEASISTFDAGGQASDLVIIRDVTERERAFQALRESENSLREAQHRVQQLAYFDSLTQIPNRTRFVEEVTTTLQDANARRNLGAALLIDLDNFKAINDNWGHRSGDKLLVEIARRLVATLPVGTFVARLGGDEFIAVLTGLGAEPQAASDRVAATCRGLLAALSAPFLLEEREHVCSASIGVALFGDAPMSADDLLSRADSAMYQAKADGRDDFRFFDQQLQARLVDLSELEADLRLSIARQELALHFQPQVDADGLTIGVEALLRWFHPTRGPVSPAVFVPLAESSGHILQLGPWILQTACTQLAAWSHDPDRADLSMAVNVSARQFHHPEFVNQVVAALRRSGANPKRLKLELTESVLAQDLHVIAQKMSALKALGVTFSLDDFGTGYSSLAYLKRLPLDQIKIDRGFVRGLPDNANDAAIVRTVIALGQQLGFEVIAEGVETQAQRAFLARHGCELFQGYLFGRPVPADELAPPTEAGRVVSS
ncbi:putative bifunctional diguanylate cyclase/phosphodiesterase [Leptothrix sp. BB-4]